MYGHPYSIINWGGARLGKEFIVRGGPVRDRLRDPGTEWERREASDSASSFYFKKIEFLILNTSFHVNFLVRPLYTVPSRAGLYTLIYFSIYFFETDFSRS